VATGKYSSSPSIEEHLIKRLQDLKQHQLAVLHKSPPIDATSLKKREDEVIHKLKEVLDKLNPLGSQKLKLLFVLAHDNLELLAQFSNESQSKLQEKIDRKYTLYGDQFLISNVPAHQMLISWYMEVKELNKHDVHELCSNNQESSEANDKYAFNIKYDPLCSKCKEMIGLSKTNLIAYQQIQTSLATMSFSTYHRGFYCRISLQAPCVPCHILSDGIGDMDAAADSDVWIEFDPCFQEIETNLYGDQLRNYTAKTVITDKIWPAIDRILTCT